MRRKCVLTGNAFSWSPEHVQDVCSWISRLPHVEGRWSTATIELQPWQVFILAASYGFRKLDGARLVTSVFFQVGRKSAKSTLVAAAALYHLAVENEPGAQVVCGASTGNQARIVFGIMQRMVKRAPWLRDLGFIAYANAITFGETGGTAKPINSKSSTQDGLLAVVHCARRKPRANLRTARRVEVGARRAVGRDAHGRRRPPAIR